MGKSYNQRSTESRCVFWEGSFCWNTGEWHEMRLERGLGQVWGGWECWHRTFRFHAMSTMASLGFQVNCFRKLNLAAALASKK